MELQNLTQKGKEVIEYGGFSKMEMKIMDCYEEKQKELVCGKGAKYEFKQSLSGFQKSKTHKKHLPRSAYPTSIGDCL